MKPQILFGDVMHKRLSPKVNHFNYGIYYLSLPLSKLNDQLNNHYFKFNRFGMLSFYTKDHGARDGKDLYQWAKNLLKTHKIDKANGEIVLVTLPRVLGYIFNPVSFWYCYDTDQKLRAVICEVNNTFGETHSYICAHDDQREITPQDNQQALKKFHVSPFLEREGHYDFRFKITNKKMMAMIDFYDGANNKKLITTLNGGFEAFNQENCSKAFWRYPLVTIKAIILIHWQALKIMIKGIKYISKPKQLTPKNTATGDNITDNRINAHKDT